MSTYNTITIHNPGTLTVATLPDSLTGDGSIWDGHSVIDEREDVPAYNPSNLPEPRFPARPGNPDGSIVIEGGSKYHADDAEADLAELSIGRRIEWTEEWDDHGTGATLTVFVDGAVVDSEAQIMDMVPTNLRALIADVRAGLRAFETDPTFPHFHLATVALVNALDPKGANA